MVCVVCVVCVLLICAIFLSILCLSQGRVNPNQKIYDFYKLHSIQATREQFLKCKYIVDLYKVNFVSKLFFHSSPVCLSACDAKSEYQQKPCHPSQTFSKLDAFLHETHSKVLLVLLLPRLKTFKSIMSLSKITHQMWRNHTFSQRNKPAKRVGFVDTN